MSLKIGLIGPEGKFGKAISALSKEQIIPIHRTTNRKTIDCDVLIDVSSPLALTENLSAEKPIVIGTTGHTNFNLIQEASQKIAVFYAPNFSLGIALMKKMAALAAPFFNQEALLIETHHERKKDAPSGTALMLADIVKKAKIQSIRSGTAIGEHQLIFSNPDEKITISHEALSREAFARGALAAAHFLKNKPAGLYGMDDLL